MTCMEMPAKLVLRLAVISALIACAPTQAWYKQVAGPSYYSVGRASGLLSGIRRSSFVRRAELDPTESEETATNSVLSDLTAHYSILKSLPLCIKDITPNLQSCELTQDPKASFKCKAEVHIFMDSSDCAGD